MQSILNWFKKFTVTTHITFATVVTAAGAIYTAYVEIPQVATLLNSWYAEVPSTGKLIVSAVVGWYVWYRNGEKPKADSQ